MTATSSNKHIGYDDEDNDDNDYDEEHNQKRTEVYKSIFATAATVEQIYDNSSTKATR